MIQKSYYFLLGTNYLVISYTWFYTEITLFIGNQQLLNDLHATKESFINIRTIFQNAKNYFVNICTTIFYLFAFLMFNTAWSKLCTANVQALKTSYQHIVFAIVVFMYSMHIVNHVRRCLSWNFLMKLFNIFQFYI